MARSLRLGDKVVVICCSHTNTHPWRELLPNERDPIVVRSVCCTLDDIGLESVLYAIEHVGAKLVIVIGHDGCAAMSSACSYLQSPMEERTCAYPSLMRAITSSFSPRARHKIMQYHTVQSRMKYAMKQHLQRVKSDIVSRVAQDVEVLACVEAFDGQVRIIPSR